MKSDLQKIADRGIMTASEAGEFSQTHLTPEKIVSRHANTECNKYISFKKEIDMARASLFDSITLFHDQSEKNVNSAKKILSKSKDTINQMNDFMVRINKTKPQDFEVFLNNLERLDLVLSRLVNFAKDDAAIKMIEKFVSAKNEK